MTSQEKPTEFHLSQVEQKAYDLLAGSSKRISELDFPKYDKSMVESDLALVTERKAQFEKEDTLGQKEAKKLSDIFELLLADLIELYNWFGDNVFIVNTSEYDDIVGGIDMITEFTKEGLSSYLGMAIDITFSKDHLDEKLRSVAKGIKDGQLPTARYFRSGSGDIIGELGNIPKVIIGASRKAIAELAEARLTLESLKKRKEDPTPSDSENLENLTKQIKEIKVKLANHPLQFEILEQILIQLKKNSDYASKVRQPEIAEKYINVLTQIRIIYNEKVSDSNFMRAVDKKGVDQATELMSLKIEESLNRILGSS